MACDELAEAEERGRRKGLLEAAEAVKEKADWHRRQSDVALKIGCKSAEQVQRITSDVLVRISAMLRAKAEGKE